jgi:microcystin-dependent protein
MALSFFETARYKLRALKGANKVSDIDAGFEALAEDLDKLIYKPGFIQWTACTAIDEGWLLCDGSAVSRTTYKALFERIGTSQGAGNGSTTFNVPDLRGRVPVGAGTGTGLTARALGAKGGEESHTLVTGEMPPHTHPAKGGGYFATYADTEAAPLHNLGSGPDGIGADSSTAAAGGGTAHNNVQPFAVLNAWIKT